ncbi:hypothetical protein D6T63_05385 [Arthrobacter cheniae]|uniref:Uncharacterized protein n=1 Tax=Arthrobacter cheniae TaxID=1258888 RepID=A0A3A5M4Z6_9MICC|nr:hypothetical protein [Arthrobacter cheniae]RJT82159.1 hypothetical protein D6T63_05385 [Arthrobacter cheniae]
MKRSAWAITVVLVLLALVAGWFFGLDARHAVALAGAAFAAGIANGLLEAVDVPRATLAPLPEPVRGLSDLQALEFSLSSTEPGTRAVREVHALALAVTTAHPGAARSPALEALIAKAQSPELSHHELGTIADELERIVLLQPVAPPRHTPPGDP